MRENRTRWEKTRYDHTTQNTITQDYMRGYQLSLIKRNNLMRNNFYGFSPKSVTGALCAKILTRDFPKIEKKKRKS